MADVSVAFEAVARLAIALRAAPIPDTGWVHQVDEHWRVTVAGKTPVGPVAAFHMAVDFKGMPAAVLSPFGGSFVVSAAANEDAFIAAVEAAIARAEVRP
jgi:hypothetical protein